MLLLINSETVFVQTRRVKDENTNILSEVFFVLFCTKKSDHNLKSIKTSFRGEWKARTATQQVRTMMSFCQNAEFLGLGGN